MYYYTISVDEEELKAAIDDLKERVNAPFNHGIKPIKPFSIVVTQEEIPCETMKGSFIRFHLVVTPEFRAKNEKQAWKFCQMMTDAAIEVKKMNDNNWMLMPAPAKGMRH